jgi:2-phosphoglycerate kinase
MKNLSQDYGVILLVVSKNEIRRRLFERYMHPTPVDFYINYYDAIMKKFYESLKLTTAHTAIIRNQDISLTCRKIIDIVKEWWNL